MARLPSSFGPGPLNLVLKEVLLRLINSSTNAIRALRRLEQQHSASSSSRLPSTRMRTEQIKAKKSKTLFRSVSIINEPTSLIQYLRHVCTKLETCPNLINLKKFNTNDACPDKCKTLSNTFGMKLQLYYYYYKTMVFSSFVVV